MKRLVIVGVVLVVGLGGALARPLPAQGSDEVLTTVAKELAKEGAKAAITQFAPDLAKHLDPGTQHLLLIRDQLEALDSKLTELMALQIKGQSEAPCVTKDTKLSDALSAVHTRMLQLRGLATQTGTSRDEAIKSFVGNYFDLTHLQHNLHINLIGPLGWIHLCGKYVESQMYPFLTSALARTLRETYAKYKAAALALLTLRANMENYKQQDPRSTDALIAEVTGWIEQEEAEFKPAVPGSLSYDERHDLVFRTTTWDWYLDTPETLSTQGWYVTGYATIPTCSAIQSVANETGLHGSAAVARLSELNVLQLASGLVACYDDHDNWYIYDLNRGAYVTTDRYSWKGRAIACRKPGPGVLEPAKYSYRLG